MRYKTSLFMAGFVTTLPSMALADSYAPFTDYRVVDATGTYYVVMRWSDLKGNAMTGVPVAFEIAQRRPGSGPVVPASERSRRDVKAGVKPEPVEVRDGDVVIGKGSLDRAPPLG